MSGNINFSEATLVAMSGGVDSSVAALYLKYNNHNPVGVTLKLINDSDHEIEAAKKSAEQLGIPHVVLDYRDEFEKYVIKPFVEAYENGDVPNPCVLCNKDVKFRLIYNMLDKLGASYLATGHYADLEYDCLADRYLLRRSHDDNKDQSYMLYHLKQDILAKTLFPLGDMTKEQVRSAANEHKFINAAKKDSQDICFIKDGKYAEFIAKYTGKTPPKGSFVDTSGRVIGTHNGAINFTIGQRKGFGIGFGQRIYVIDKDMEKNTVTLGSQDELFAKRVTARNINLIALDKIDHKMRVKAKTRYRIEETSAVVYQTGEDEIVAEFDSPVRAVTKGQSLVLYDGRIVVGGGIIVAAE